MARGRSTTFLLKKYHDMIRERAWHYAKSYNRNFEDLLGEGYMNFMRAVERWDGERNFGTLLWTCLNNGIHRFVLKNDPPPVPPEGEDISPSDGYGTPADHLVFKEKLIGLSIEARTVVQIVLKGPAEALGVIGHLPPKKIREAIRNFLMRKHGCTRAEACSVIEEIREALR